ncbi:MAG: hypothetical protein COC06_05405 [Bacteroidales bacterium]|nr:MAG: hypothetical protein COC06_05405 [Bacteroidales bacterium]
MKTNIILLLSLLLVLNVKLAYSQKIGKARSILSNSQLEQMKQMPPDEAKIFRNSIIRAWSDCRMDSIRRQMQKQREIPDGPPTMVPASVSSYMDHSPFELSQQQQDSVKKAQRKIIARYKKTHFMELDKCDKEIVMIAKAKFTMLTYAPCYYREGPNVAPPLISEEISDYYDRPYSEIRFSYDPEQEAHYAYFEKSKLPDTQEQVNLYRYCGDIHGGYTAKYLNLYPNVMVEIWTDTGEVKGIVNPYEGWDIWAMSEQELRKIKFKYSTLYIKDDKLREQLEAPQNKIREIEFWKKYKDQKLREQLEAPILKKQKESSE